MSCYPRTRPDEGLPTSARVHDGDREAGGNIKAEPGVSDRKKVMSTALAESLSRCRERREQNVRRWTAGAAVAWVGTTGLAILPFLAADRQRGENDEHADKHSTKPNTRRPDLSCYPAISLIPPFSQSSQPQVNIGARPQMS